MRDAIAWSHDLLSPLEQRVFRRISVFVDGFTLDAAQLVWEQGLGNDDQETDSSFFPSPQPLASSPSILSLLGALLDKSLVRQESGADGEPRFRMLETIREFGLERLAESAEETAIRDRHATYYLNLAQEADLRLMAVGSAAWVERLTMERANLREAIAWALDHDWAEPVLRLAGAFAYARGLPAEELAWIEAALTKRAAVPAEVQVNALFTASALAQVQGDFAKANLLSEDGLAMSRASGYLFGEGRALLNLGITAEWQGDLDLAATHYQTSHQVMRQLQDADQRSHLTMLPLANLADIAMLRGDYVHAAAMATEAVARWRVDGYT
jgi:non-specific serine/threonine protein kinase